MGPIEDPVSYGIFEVLGIELEYMIVDRESLQVRPVADELFFAVTGSHAGDYEDGPIAWSNELALHVVELKTNGPARDLAGLADRFCDSAARIDGILRGLGARLLPTGMHPTMDPAREARIWQHEYSPVYEAYNRIFDCRGHGWSNLQSCHLNLPFHGDEEFARLHLALRALLPLMPALAASSPFFDGRYSGFADARLEVYRGNQKAVPSIVGSIVPEPVTSRDEYLDVILRPMWADIAAHDPEGILRHEWLNSRGAIARFDRSAIEIRVLDVQESPYCDLAICALIVAAAKALSEERWCGLERLRGLETGALRDLLLATVREAERAVVADGGLLSCLGLPPTPITAGDVWRHLRQATMAEGAPEPLLDAALDCILTRGPLARRMLAAAGECPDRSRLTELCRRLADCLVPGRPPIFVP